MVYPVSDCSIDMLLLLLLESLTSEAFFSCAVQQQVVLFASCVCCSYGVCTATLGLVKVPLAELLTLYAYM